MRVLRLIIIITIIFTVFSCSHNAKQIREKIIPEISNKIFIDLNQEIIDKKANWIDGIFQHLYKKRGFNGTVLYAEKGHLIYKKAFGIGDRRKKDSLTTHSSFQLASVSKMFTSTAIMIF